jgi:hypothetical protein
MGAFNCQSKSLPGSQYAELAKQARKLFHEIEKMTKRQPYIRSPYFDKEKIFLNSFWQHLEKKGLRDKARRLKLYNCAIELIGNSRLGPSNEPYKSDTEILYRFLGLSADNRKFVVQIREDRKSGQKYFSSVFPYEE